MPVWSGPGVRWDGGIADASGLSRGTLCQGARRPVVLQSDLLAGEEVTKRNLILVYLSPSYKQDFDEIAAKVHAIDKTIDVYYLPAGLKADLPAGAWQYPTLTISLVPRFECEIKRGPVLRNRPIEKLDQQALFQEYGIPIPYALPFRFGMKLDTAMFGDLVILKPMDLRLTSGSHSVFPFKTRQLENVRLNELPLRHPIRTNADAYMVQRFIYTGPYPRHLRVHTFFGRTIFCMESRLKQVEPIFDFDMEFLRNNIVTTSSGERSRELTLDQEAMQLAELAHGCFRDIPSLGFDVIRDHYTRELYVLECNAGGNTWHFSSETGRVAREYLGEAVKTAGDRSAEGRRAMIEQLGAFDIVAETLVSKVRELAS